MPLNLQIVLQDIAARLASLDPKAAAAPSSITLFSQPVYHLMEPERAALQAECRRLRKAAKHNFSLAISCRSNVPSS